VVEPLFFAAIGDDTKVGSRFVLSGSEAKHAVSVRRMEVGEAISVTDGAGKKVRGNVTAVGKDFLELEVSEIDHVNPPNCKIYLVQALAKGDRDELAIQACTELGVQGVIPWQADRSVSVWKEEKKQKGQLRWQTIVSEAAKQSLRAFVPIVESVVDSQNLEVRLKQFDHVVILHTEGATSITETKLPEQGSVAVVVGPEGGLSDQEVELFKAAGFTSVHLGAGVLRTSTAGMAAVSYLQSKLGDWN